MFSNAPDIIDFSDSDYCLFELIYWEWDLK